MSAIADIMVELAEELEVIIYNLRPLHLQDFLSEIHWAIDNEVLPKEYDWDWWDNADWFDIALCCVSTGASFDNGEVMDFLWGHEATRRRYENTDIYGREVVRRRFRKDDDKIHTKTTA